MEKRIPYYVSRKNFFTWIAAITIVASIILRIMYIKEAGIESVWVSTLPVLAGIIYAVIIIFDGKEHLYRTLIPAIMFSAYLCVKIGMSGSGFRWIFLACVAYIALAIFFGLTVDGRVKSTWSLFIILLASLVIMIYSKRKIFASGNIEIILPYLPDMLMILGSLFMICAMQIHLDGEYHPTWGDRPDGRRIRTLDPVTIVANYIMPTRNGASNFIMDSVEITEIEKYILEKRKEGYKGFGITHLFLAAYVRCVAKYPRVNRFIAGQRVYSRGNDIQFCMVVKAEMNVDAEESIVKLHLSPRDTVFDIYEKLSVEIEKIKSNPVGGSTFDKTAKLFSYIPGVVFRFVMGIISFMDYFGLLPKMLLEISPFHASVFFTSMASLGIPPVVHHLYDFGNMPVFCSFGTKRFVNEIDDKGKLVKKKYIDYTFNTDERIVDGFYYASVFKYMKKLLAHPEKLELPAEEVAKDID